MIMRNCISEIEIIPLRPNNGLVGIASLVYDNCFYLGSIGIMTRPQGGYRLSYPTRQGAKLNFNVFYPINNTIAQEIEQAIIARFEEVVGN
jgi:DNA-binding cell septation regulator SpoVG